MVGSLQMDSQASNSIEMEIFGSISHDRIMSDAADQLDKSPEVCQMTSTDTILMAIKDLLLSQYDKPLHSSKAMHVKK